MTDANSFHSYQLTNERSEFAEQVLLIHSYHPELAITQTKSGSWEWSFRRIASEDLEGAEDGFWSPLAALAHYARWVSDQADLMMEQSYPSIG